MAASGSDTRHREPLFRSAAVEAARFSLFGRPCVVVPPGASSIAGASVVMVALLGAALWFVEIPVRIPAMGMLMPPGGLLDVVVGETGLVSAVHVDEGATVDAGELLFEITPHSSGASGETVSSRELASLRIELGILDVVAERRRQTYRARHDALLEERLAAERRLENIAEQQSAIAEETNILTDRLGRVRSLADAGHVPREAQDSEKLALLRARSTAAMIEAQRNAAHSEVLRLHGRAEALHRELELADAEHALQSESLKRQIERKSHLALQQVRAPAAGTVVRVLTQRGMAVRANQGLAKIVSGNGIPEAWLYVAAAQARRISPGETVELQFDAFPAADHGARTATVRAVSSVPLGPTELPVPLSFRGPVFEVRAEINVVDADEPALLTGAAIRAQIISARFRLYEWLTRRLRSGHESASAGPA